jgi:glycine betaine/proline transport system substrate-binding protein
MNQHPEFKTWQGFKGKELLFKTPESGNQGMFLAGDPSYVSKDRSSSRGSA